MESRNLVPGDLMKLTLGKNTHIEIRDVGDTFSFSFNGVVHCTIDYSGHVLPTRTGRETMTTCCVIFTVVLMCSLVSLYF